MMRNHGLFIFHRQKVVDIVLPENVLRGVSCIAAPVFDSGPLPAAAVGISGNDRERVLSMADKVKLTAEVITHVLSPTRPLGGIA